MAPCGRWILSKLTGDYLDGVVDAEEQLAALDHLALVHTMPTTVAVSAVIEPAGTLGMVTDLQFLGIQIDADIWGSGIAGGSGEARKRWRDLARLGASALERRLFEDYEITSISADMALILAQAQGVEILHIDAGNLGAALATLPFDSGLESEIEAWVLSGGEADVPVTPLDFVQWSGVGYVLRDPATGEAKYQLAGGLSGGMTAVPRTEAHLHALKKISWPPSKGIVIREPALVDHIEVWPQSQGQMGEVGTQGQFGLRVQALDKQNRPVAGVQLTFEKIAGLGNLLDNSGTPVAGPVDLVTTDSAGSGLLPGETKCDFVYGIDTSSVAFYGLLDPNDRYGTRFGGTVFKVRSDPGGYEKLIYTFSTPGPLHSLGGARIQWSNYPEMLAGRVWVIAEDSHGNPVANIDLDFKEWSHDGHPDGVVLSYEVFDEVGGPHYEEFLLSDVPIALRNPTLKDLSRSDGKMAVYVVLGANVGTTSRLVVNASQGTAGAEETFTFDISDPVAGDVVAFWGGRPMAQGGLWTEGYGLGTVVPQPIVLDVFRVVEDASGKHMARILPANGYYDVDFSLEGCLGSLSATGDVTVMWGWSTVLTLDRTPGYCTVVGEVKYETDGDEWVARRSSHPPIAAVTVDLLTDGSDPLIVATGEAAKAYRIPSDREHPAVVRNQAELRFVVQPGNYRPASSSVEVSQTNTLQFGPTETQLLPSAERRVVLGDGFAFELSRPVTARIVLNRSIQYFTGDESYTITSPSRYLDVAAVTLDRNSLDPDIVFDNSRDRWVLKLPINNRPAGEFRLVMPSLEFEVGPQAASIPVPYPPLAGSQSFQSRWEATLAWDALRYNSRITASRVLSASHVFGGSGGRTWVIPFGDVFDGGELVVTAKVKVPKRSGGGDFPIEALDSWKIFARGEDQTTPLIVTPVIDAWVTAKQSYSATKASIVRDAMKGSACRETKNRHFRGQLLNFFPQVSFDGGYGLFQITSGVTPEIVWDWIKNLAKGGERAAICYGFAKGFLENPDGNTSTSLHWDPNIPPPQYTLDQLLKETLACFNWGPGHHYHRPVIDLTIPTINKVIGVEADFGIGQYCDPTSDNNRMLFNGAFQYYSGICYANRTDCSP